MNSILQLTCNCWARADCASPTSQTRATEVIITGRCQNPPAYFDLAGVHSGGLLSQALRESRVELKRGVDF